MPLYEYQCESCAKRFERIQKFSDPPIGTCPSCGGPVKKLFSSPAIQFKGSGWYITDYARKASDGGGKSKEGSADTSKSDSGAPATPPSSSSDSTAKGDTTAKKD